MRVERVDLNTLVPPCSREELRAWGERIAACGADEAWVYFDNDRNGQAVKNAPQLRRLR